MVINFDVKRIERQIEQEIQAQLTARKQQITELYGQPGDEGYMKQQVLEGEISGLQAAHRIVQRLLDEQNV